MNRIVTSMLVLGFSLAVIASGWAADVNMEKKLIGTWHGKTEVDEKKFKAPLGANLDAAIAQFKNRLSGIKMELTFSPDGSHRSKEAGGGRDLDEKSTWAVVKEDEKEKTITIKTVDTSKNEATLTVTFINDDKFTLHVNELEQAPVKDPTFTRVKKKSKEADLKKDDKK